jgi:hypothetical protein
VKWVATEDRGPNGATGKARFKPAFSVGLLVTLYKVFLKKRISDHYLTLPISRREGVMDIHFLAHCLT